MLQTVILLSENRISSEKCKGNCLLWWSQPVQLQTCLLGTRDHQHISLEMRQSLSYSKAHVQKTVLLFCVWVFFGVFFPLKINQRCQRALTLHRQTIFHNSLLLLNLLGKSPMVLMASHPLPSGEMMKPSAGVSARKPRLRRADDLTLPGQSLQGGACVQTWHRGCGEHPQACPALIQSHRSSSSPSFLILLLNCTSCLNKDFLDSSLSVLWTECGSKMTSGTAWGETQKTERAIPTCLSFPVKPGWSQTATKHYKCVLINSHNFSDEENHDF